MLFAMDIEKEMHSFHLSLNVSLTFFFSKCDTYL